MGSSFDYSAMEATGQATSPAAANLFSSAVAVLLQFRDVLAQVADSSDPAALFTRESSLVPLSTLGKHTRHVLDHYIILLDTVRRHLGDGRWTGDPVTYDRRSRDVPCERDVHVAQVALDGTCAALRQVESHIRQQRPSATRLDLDTVLAVQKTVDPAKADITVASTFGRELCFVLHHAIHHAALLRVILTEFGLRVPPAFGIAPSTERAHV
ncbi:hypothetical protein HK101_009067 [Irineochytrium annulatum]|nr:hypothetical protein HK101_009067 [Irineochytrium annulatum]